MGFREVGRIYNRFIDLLAGLAGLLTVVLMALISFAVLSRYGLGRGVGWSTEVAAYLLFAITCLAAPWILRSNDHVRIDLLWHSFGEVGTRRLYLITSIAGFLICAGAALYAGHLAIDLHQRGVRVVRVMAIERWIFIALLFFSLILLAIEFVRHIYRAAYIKSVPDHVSTGPGT